MIRTDYYDGAETYNADPADMDLHIWGDWAYGPDDDPYNPALQYGVMSDPNKDHDLWGDDDKLYGGKGVGSKSAYYWAGDGDDLIVMGDNWLNGKAYGMSGDDTIMLPGRTIFVNFYGGDGDD